MRRNSKNKVQLESMKDKSTLVKLLAEEDVSVSYQKVSTASFNIETREVTLPIWKDKSEGVMDMMSLHEVGHALYTPMDLIDKGKEKEVSHSFLNVLEDVRIEKMIQDKYLGSKKVFKKAYKELISKDFFGVKDKDLSKLNLIDRINMHYKNVPNVPFDDDELEWVEKSNKTKTPDDVVNLAVEMQEYMKNSEKENESDEEFELESTMPSDDNTEDNNTEDSTEEKSSDFVSSMLDEKEDETPKSNNATSEKVEEDKEPTEETEEKTFSKGSEGKDKSSIEATTDTNYQKKQYQAVDKNASRINYLNIPKVNLKNAIVDYKVINDELNEHYKRYVIKNNQYLKWWEYTKKELAKYKNDQKSTISYMVKEFEMKKSADLYKRSTVSRTGSLNMDKLHSYAYNEDIFLKMNVEPSATNHGLVMFIDWSGSMTDNFKNTIKQTLNLVWFCERINIPFEVYGFTNGYGKRDDTNKNLFIQERKHNDLIINDLTLLNLLSSRSNKKEMLDGLNNLYAMGNYYDKYNKRYSWKEQESMGYEINMHDNYQLYSTPLNQSIIVAMDLIPKFKKDNGLQKVHTVFLTDGASNSINDKYAYKESGTDRYGKWESGIHREDIYSEFGYDDDVITRVTDPVTKKVWQGENKKGDYRNNVQFRYSIQTPVLIEFLKNRVPGMNVVNFFIAGKSKSGTISKSDIEHIFNIGWSENEKLKKIQKELRTKNVAVVTDQAWTEMYVLPGGVKLDTSTEDLSDVQVGAKKGELKRAFGKMTSGRKNQRPLLNKFIGMIA